MKKTMTILRFVCTSGLFVLLSLPAIAKTPQKDDWHIRENLVTRLSGEWYKINVFNTELSSVKDILDDLRDMELVSPSVTRLSDDSLIAFDKKIERCEKKYAALQKQIGTLKLPLSDALAILREMVVGQPIEDMFSVLDNDDLARISAMMDIKHHADSLWISVDTLVNVLGAKMKLSLPQKESAIEGFDAEFFQILQANLGQKAQWYYHVLDVMKTALALRNKENAVSGMYPVEIRRVKKCLQERNLEKAVRSIKFMQARYDDKSCQAELAFLLVKAYFEVANYDSALVACAAVHDTSRFGSELLLYKLQSQYQLGKYDTIWNVGQKFPFWFLKGKQRNCALWMVMESGLALRKTAGFGDLVSLIEKDSSYAIHVLHALARSYILQNDFPNALQVFESADKFKQPADIDKNAFLAVRLCAAQTQFEKGNYQKSLTSFFSLLNSEDETIFSQALFGISWCYIKLGMYQKAELSLRKLINQSPNSPLAVKAMLVMGQRKLNKIQFDWDKLTFLANAESRLSLLKKGLTEKTADTLPKASRERVKAGIARVDELLARLKNEKRETPATIAANYDEITRLSNLIQKMYATGSYQEIAFSEKREVLLHVLDSLTLCATGTRQTSNAVSFTNASQSVGTIKQLVFKSKVFDAKAQIDRYRWEKENVDWQKGNTKKEIDQTIKMSSTAKDSAERVKSAMRIGQLNATMDSLVKAGDKIHERWYGQLTKTCEELTSLPLEVQDEIYLRYHNAELHYTQENEQYAQAYSLFEANMARYDSLIRLFRDGKEIQMPQKPVEPSLSHDSSTMQLGYILGKYPRSELDYAVRYSLAWCYNDKGKFDTAVAMMDSLTRLYPDCQYAPQAWMYIGEYMFEHGKLDGAVKAYQAVLTYPESEWFDKALYKLAWAQYRMSNPEKAISSFLALVDLGGKNSYGKSLLEKESIDYIAISFSETDVTGERGLERATNFVQRFGDMAKGTEILHRLATIYKDQGRLDMAQKTYRTLLRIYPEYKQSPQIESELLAVIQKTEGADQSNFRSYDFFSKYNRNGEWAKAQSDKRVIAEADSLAQNHLYTAALSFHQMALQKNDSALYQTATKQYEDFITTYPTSARAPECHYNLAEIQFSIGNYQRAAEEYMAVSKRYADPKYKETAAWNAIVATQNLLKKEGAH